MRVDGLGTARAVPAASPDALQVYCPIVCPRCGADRPSVDTVRPSIRYYSCRLARCRHEFKVPVQRR